MKPNDVNVDLSGGGQATVSVFDLEAMILSLLLDESLMKEENLAPGYDLHSGKPTEPVTHYGEVHTGDAWEGARDHYCGVYPHNMPIALIIFGDKSHFDLHGTLATTPVCFTLSCFCEKARNSVDFWRPMGYLPNLSYGKVSKPDDDHIRRNNVQDEHDCLAVVLQPLIDITRRGGIAATIKNRAVIGKVWIHYIIGDTQGLNRWLGHFNGSGKLEMPYRDCYCSYDNMNNPNPNCEYVTLKDYHEKKEDRERETCKTRKQAVDKSWSKHDIKNAFMREGVPLSDLCHGIFRMMPPELLHTTSEGTTEYMIETLKHIIGDDVVGKRLCNVIETLHHTVHNDLKRNSDKDIPRGTARTGLLKNTLVNANERRGNLFRLLCLSHTDRAQNWLFPCLEKNGIDPQNFLECIKLYLSMEEWFHETNSKVEVQSARPLIAHVIQLVHEVFPRTKGNGWNLPKTHGLTKMQYYMCLFGSAINFFGGPGECNHKKIVKDTGNNTQCRIDSFTSQVALRYYETLLYEIAKQASDRKMSNKYEEVGNKNTCLQSSDFDGEYSLTVEGMTSQGLHTTYSCRWKNNNSKKSKCDVSYKFLTRMTRFAHDSGWTGALTITGYTSFKLELDGSKDIFRATVNYGHDGPWYDWCMVDFFDDKNNTVTYPACILGFFKFDSNVVTDEPNGTTYAVVQSSHQPLPMSQLKEEFISKIVLGQNLDNDLAVVPVNNISHSLCVFKNKGGSIREYFCSLPRRKWGRYFGDQIDLPQVEAN